MSGIDLTARSDDDSRIGRELTDPTQWPWYAGGEVPPRRIGGKLCPFCRNEIPHDFIYCISCGRDV